MAKQKYLDVLPVWACFLWLSICRLGSLTLHVIEPKTSVQFNFQAFRKSNSVHSAHCQFEADFIFTLILWNLNGHPLKFRKAAGVELIVPTSR